MKNIIKLICIVVLFLSVNSCGTFKVSTLSYDPIYTTANGETIDVNVVDNEWELNRLLRDDFRFRYDYAQYAKSQPISFDWNNRILRNNRFNRYNFNNRYGWNNTWNYSSYWNRDQMWDDWLWGYSSMNYGMGWSYSWGNNSWSSNHWNSPYGWNNYYGWGNGYGWNNNGWNNGYRGYRRGSNVYGRRSSNRSPLFNSNSSRSSILLDSKVSTSEGRTYNSNTASLIENIIIRNANKPRVLPNSKPLVNNSKPVIINKPIIRNNNRPVINNNNSKPRINNSSSRPNFNRPVSRPSVPKTNTNTNRKGKNPR